MDSVATLILFTLLITFVSDATASCRKVANKEMLEYLCEGGHPVDLTTVPETTEKLRIIRMPLRRITADTFARFGGNLWVLSCSHCEITDIDADAFRRLANLQQLSLDNNRLTTVRASWFEGLNYLTYLDFNYNDIGDIEDDVYKNIPSLVDFRISGNRLRCLNLDEMSHLKELKRMFLSENPNFACPHAISKFLENQGVVFEQDTEWRRLTSDTIDVHVPPNYLEEDKEETVPVYRQRLHPGRKPSSEELEESYAGDKTFYPSHSEHHSRHRRPPTTTTVRPITPKPEDLPLPRVEPRLLDTRLSHVPSESSSHQIMSYPYSTPETPRIPPSEDIIDELSQMEYTLMHSPSPTHETTSRWSYPTTERSQVPPVPLSGDNRIAGTDRPPETERMLTHSPYIPTHETMPYSSYPTSERSRVLIVGSSEDETVNESEKQSQAENVITYPLYITTADGLKRTSHGVIQVTQPSFSNSDMVTFGAKSTNSIEHPASSSWTQERHEQSRRPGGNDRATWSTPYYRHDPLEMIVEESSSKSDDESFVVTDPVKYDRSPAMTTPKIHYIAPSSSELMHSPSTSEVYQAPYYESTVTLHPLLQRYQEDNGTIPSVIPLTTTDKPLPECSENSAPKARPAVALVMFIVFTVLGPAVVERF